MLLSTSRTVGIDASPGPDRLDGVRLVVDLQPALAFTSLPWSLFLGPWWDVLCCAEKTQGKCATVCPQGLQVGDLVEREQALQTSRVDGAERNEVGQAAHHRERVVVEGLWPADGVGIGRDVPRGTGVLQLSWSPGWPAEVGRLPGPPPPARGGCQTVRRMRTRTLLARGCAGAQRRKGPSLMYESGAASRCALSW